MNSGASAFARKVAVLLEASGLWGAELVSATPESSFPYACAIFRLGPLLLKFLSDRGQEFLDVASSAEPDEFFHFCDIDIAMKWKTIDEVLARQELEELDDILARLAIHRDDLYVALASSRQPFKRASANRGAAFVNWLTRRK